MWHRERLLLLATLIAAGPLPPGGPVRAEVVIERGDTASRTTSRSERAAETGGLQVVPAGRLRLTCTQHGERIADQEVSNVAISPRSAVGWLSFDLAGAQGRGVLLPFGDGRMACLLLAKGADLKRVSAAFEAAIDENRPASWSTPVARASGRVVPGRTFVDAQGRTCREFIQTTLVDDRTDQTKGVVCEHAGGGWRLAP